MSEEEQIILPERFKRLSSIITNGTQWIDTGYVPTNTTGFWVDSIDNGNTNNYVMGINETTDWNSNNRMYIRTSTNLLYGWMTYTTVQNINSYNKRIIASLNFLNSRKASWTLEGASYESGILPDLTFTPSKSLYISAINYGGSPSTYISKLQIFEAKISEGTEVVRHFIPVYDTYLARGCMYEIIEGKAYYNKGSGDFLYDLGLEDEQLGVLHKLPEGFKGVKYLIANGYQYIDTNYVPTNETGYYLEGQGYVSESTVRYYFGSNETTDWNLNQRIYFGATPNNFLGWMTSLTVTSDGAKLRQETNVALNFLNSRKCVTTINDADIINELEDLTFTPSQKIFLFNINLGGNVHTRGLKGRIDTFLISEGEQIVRQFVPCLDVDGIPCMYELYTGTVHYNQGSGQFSYPREYINDPINLPAGYTKCVYLQSNGTQWIDTEVIPDADTGVYLKAQHLSYGDFTPFGSWESSSAYYYPPRFNTNNKSGTYSFGTTYQLSFYYDKGDDLVFTSTMNLYNDRTVNFWSEDTNWFGIIPVNFTASFTRPLWLFSYNMDNTSINATYAKFSGRIFRAKITQGTSLIHDYVPCLDDSGRPCMYDLIDRIPLYNQSGGVEFAYCVEHQLPSDFIKLKYLESTGTQIIKTGIIPTDSTGIYVDAYHTKHNGNTNGSVIGLRNTNGNTYFYVGRVQRDTNGAGFGWGAFTTPNGTGNVRYEASLNFLNDRQSIITAPSFAQRVNALGTLSFTPTKDLYMFGMNNYDGAATLHSTYRIYRAKISEGNEIVRDWVPAYDQRNSFSCMYDLINNVPYYNNGTGEFTYNKDFEGDYIGCGILGGIGNRLGYFEKEDTDDIENYLLLNENEYIVSEIIPEIGYKIEIDCFIQESDAENTYRSLIFYTDDNQRVFLIQASTSETGGGLTIIGQQNCIMGTTAAMVNERGVYYIETFADRVDITFNNTNVFTYEGILNMDGAVINPFTPSLYFGYKNAMADSNTNMIIYNIKIYDTESNEISNMIPHEENGQKGLYCTVRNIFLPVQTIE